MYTLLNAKGRGKTSTSEKDEDQVFDFGDEDQEDETFDFGDEDKEKTTSSYHTEYLQSADYSAIRALVVQSSLTTEL
jgi:hypothetical protein